jgi:hypothetical protein
VEIEKEFILTNFLDLLYTIEELLDTDRYIDKRKWLPLFYGNRLGFLPYETEEEKQKILNDPRFFGYFDKEGKAILTKDKEYRETNTYSKSKNKFTLEI